MPLKGLFPFHVKNKSGTAHAESTNSKLFPRNTLTLFVCSFAYAQDTTGVGSISGLVKASNGGSVANVQVCVESTNRCANTDAQGFFKIPEVRAGEALLTVTAPGQPALKNVKAEVRAGLDAGVDINRVRDIKVKKDAGNQAERRFSQ